MEKENISADTAEQWKDVVGYEGYYQVSNIGRVRSVDRIVGSCHGSKANRKGVIKKLDITNRGYSIVVLFFGNVSKGYLCHRLVAEAFIQNPNKKPDVNHKNGIKTDNRVDNLEWVTRSENVIHAMETGLKKDYKGKKVICVLNGKKYASVNEAAMDLGLNSGTLRTQITRAYKSQILFPIEATPPLASN